MRETCTSGSMRGSDGRGVACNGRPSLSTLPKSGAGCYSHRSPFKGQDRKVIVAIIDSLSIVGKRIMEMIA